ncbi:hypothetical protein J2Z40_002932 [Cytobacillus eiseniae]|uniref:SbsC C-terminal domain-containing protein n=1 Tax=Cytobacillus eiseniae TaxID=762947 RepID=A0ABS4RHJ8_9BACI|nr:Ig-like domain-containing protein [Cytobacillus eiseniae]MBP2242358.1 hypothetical protein [Cytobacillus eiseniae]
MDKKKAIKVLGATAIAASAFVATSPAGADAAANDVQSLVKKAKDAGTVLKWAISTEGSADGTTRPWAQYNAAKDTRDAAVAAINKLSAAEKAGYLADIEQNVTLHINRAMSYIDAITAGEKINVKKEALEAQIEKNLIDDNTEAAYHALSTEIRKQAILLDRVYGQSTRDEIRDNYKKSAETVRDSVKYEVSAKIELDLAAKAIAADDTATADKHLTEAAKYMKDVKNETMKAALVKTVTELEAQMTPEVKSVSSINATQVEIKFNKVVDPASLFTNGKDGAFKANTVSLTSLDIIAPGALSGTLSEDGKTLIVTAENPLSKRYDVVVDNVLTKEGKTFPKYAKMSTFEADATAPSIISTTRVSANSVKVIFSEPIKSLGTVSYKLADGTTVATSNVTNDFTPGSKEVTFTLGAGIAVNKEVIATFIGAQDQAGNLMSPNPATVSLVKGDKDGVAPTVSTITQTGAKTFALKFSEQLFAKPVVKINGSTVTTSDVVQDTTDPTVYNVTSSSVLDGATTIAVESFTDLSGEVGTNLSKVITFVKETAAPKMVTSAVVTDATDKKEYLEITFDKDVVLSTPTVDATSGSYVKDFVTTSLVDGDIAPKTVAYKSATDKKIVRVDLATFLGANDVKGANYKLNLSFTGITSAANVTANNVQVTFTRGEDGIAANTDIVAVTNVAQGSDNNKVAITFDKAVDGGSAINPENYKIDGAIVESVTLNAAVTSGSSTTQVAILNLKEGSNGFTGTRNINITNVKALGSTKTMNPYFINTITLNENVAPVVTSAELTATNKITLTFSEAVTDSSANDFEVLIGGKSQGIIEEVSAGIGSANTTVVVTITGIDATELAQGISLKGLSTLDIVDAAGNKLSVPANITVSH